MAHYAAPPSTYHPNGESICIEEEHVEEHCRVKGRGVEYEPCFYCKTCAKLAGETCRGNQLIHGHCDKDKDLECIGDNNRSEPGVCIKKGGPPIKNVGEECGGRLDSLGMCKEGSKCTELNATEISVCIRNGKYKLPNVILLSEDTYV